MNWKYWLLTGITFLVGVGLLFLPGQDPSEPIRPKKLLAAITIDSQRFISPDELTGLLLQEDPSLVLIDIRPREQFDAFAIPKAVSIPTDSLFTDASLEILRQREKEVVLYSNSGAEADQAWLICQRLGIHHVHVLEGGINNWFRVIVEAQKPHRTEPFARHERYRFRVAAREYFYGVSESEAAPPAPKKVVQPAPRRSEASESEGC